MTILFLVGLSQLSHAGCPQRSEWDRLSKAVKIQLRGTEPKNLDTKLCDEKSEAHKLLQTLKFLENLNFDGSQKKLAWDQNILTQKPWDYFQQRTKLVTSGDISYCSDTGFTAYVDLKKPGIVYLCGPFFDPRSMLYENVETLLHEVRHFAGHDHVTCTRGPKKGGEGLCDESLEQKGSYAVTFETYLKMATQSDQVPKAMTSLLKSSAMIVANELFNKPIEPKGLQAVLLTTNRGQHFFFDGTKLTPFDSPTTGQFLSQTREVLLIPEDLGDITILDLYSARKKGTHAPQSGLIQSYNELPKSDRYRIIRYFSTSEYAGLVGESQFRGGLNEDPEYFSINLPFKVLKAFQSSEIGAKSSTSIFLVTDSSQLMELKLLPKMKYKLSEYKAKNRDDLLRLKAQTELNGQKIRLLGNGQLESRFTNQVWTPVALPKDLQVVQMSESFYWSDLLLEESTK